VNIRRVAVQRAVFTGGPGAGKTAVLDVLCEKGFAVGEDAARCIIRERKDAGLSPRPAPQAFAELILEREITAYSSAVDSPTFFERGVVEAVAMLYGADGLHDPSARQLMDEFRYEHIFLFPPWAEIYCTDSERDHTFDHAVRVYEGTRKWYLRFGYSLVEVPLCSPQERAEFILAHCAGA
jgi:predicted ATPase